jgi:hypothetical protein
MQLRALGGSVVFAQSVAFQNARHEEALKRTQFGAWYKLPGNIHLQAKKYRGI